MAYNQWNRRSREQVSGDISVDIHKGQSQVEKSSEHAIYKQPGIRYTFLYSLKPPSCCILIYCTYRYNLLHSEAHIVRSTTHTQYACAMNFHSRSSTTTKHAIRRCQTSTHRSTAAFLRSFFFKSENAVTPIDIHICPSTLNSCQSATTTRLDHRLRAHDQREQRHAHKHAILHLFSTSASCHLTEQNQTTFRKLTCLK